MFCRDSWRDGMVVNWFNATGGEQLPEHWLEETPLCMHLGRDDLKGMEGVWSDVLVIFNPKPEKLGFTLPEFKGPAWRLELTTEDPERSGEAIEDGTVYEIDGRAMAIFSRV